MSLRIYLIGAGVISRTHAKALGELDSEGTSELAVADPNPDALRDFAQEFPHARLFEKVEDMLKEPSHPEDIVIVATPPFTHFELVRKALETKRHVLCEKPFAVNQEQAEEMLRLARANEVLIGCCSSRFLGSPATEKVKQLLQTDQLGKLYHMSFIHRTQRGRPGIEYQPTSTWFLSQELSGGGILMDWGPYDFSTLNDVLSPVKIEVVSAWQSNPHTQNILPAETVFDVETHAGAHLLYHLADGSIVPVHYERSSCTHGAERAITEIEGTNGAVQWDWHSWQGPGVVSHSYDKEGEIETNETLVDGKTVAVMDRPLHYFYEKVKGNPSPAVVNEQAVFNFSVIQAIYRCAATGEAQVVDSKQFQRV